jgi:hypothetical protein
MRRITAVSVTVFAIGLVVFFGTSWARKSERTKYQPSGFTMIQTEKIIRPGQDAVQVGLWTRMVTSRGEWKRTGQRFHSDGSVTIEQSVGTERGVFAVRNGADGKPETLELLSMWLPSEALHIWYSPQTYKTSPGFAREENLLGYKAYVLRDEGKTDSNWMETYYIPQLGSYWAKEVTTRPGLTTVIEAVSVDMHEPSEALIKAPDLPEGTSLMQKKIDDLARKGQTEAAEAWGRQLGEHNKLRRR